MLCICCFQVLALNNNEKELLANHLAHDLHTHNNYYKLQLPAMSLAKISRLLMAAEEGKISKFRGKSLEEIDLQG